MCGWWCHVLLIIKVIHVGQKFGGFTQFVLSFALERTEKHYRKDDLRFVAKSHLRDTAR